MGDLRNVVFVAPVPAQNSFRYIRALAGLSGVRLLGICQQPPSGPEASLFTDVARVGNALDADDIARGLGWLQARHGAIHRITGVLEELQVPLAEVRARHGVEGPTPEIAWRFRDKAHMKDWLRRAGLPCAHHRLLRSEADAWAFVREVGFPIVLKPPAGVGCVDTLRADDPAGLRHALSQTPPRPDQPVLAEEHLQGEEFTFDAITVGHRPVFHSISRYAPNPLHAVLNPWIKLCIVTPRDISGPEFDPARALGVRVLQAFGLRDGMTHMEWFRRRDGSLAVGEIAARPAGSRIIAINELAHSWDFARVWARAVVDGAFDGPTQRTHAAGVAFLRGPGEGRVAAVEGVAAARAAIGGAWIDAKLPQLGEARNSRYTGEGWVLVRHPSTEGVEWALSRIIETIQVHYQ